MRWNARNCGLLLGVIILVAMGVLVGFVLGSLATSTLRPPPTATPSGVPAKSSFASDSKFVLARYRSRWPKDLPLKIWIDARPEWFSTDRRRLEILSVDGKSLFGTIPLYGAGTSVSFAWPLHWQSGAIVLSSPEELADQAVLLRLTDSQDRVVTEEQLSLSVDAVADAESIFPGDTDPAITAKLQEQSFIVLDRDEQLVKTVLPILPDSAVAVGVRLVVLVDSVEAAHAAFFQGRRGTRADPAEYPNHLIVTDAKRWKSATESSISIRLVASREEAINVLSSTRYWSGEFTLPQSNIRYEPVR